MKIRLCPMAQKHHAQSSRQFAHVFHKRDTICVTPEFYDLPPAYQTGILLHELGHIALMGKQHSEKDADHMIWETHCVNIVRKDYRGMKNLEYIRRKDMSVALEVIDYWITDK